MAREEDGTETGSVHAQTELACFLYFNNVVTIVDVECGQLGCFMGQNETENASQCRPVFYIFTRLVEIKQQARGVTLGHDCI